MVAISAFLDEDWAAMRDTASFHRGDGLDFVHKLHTAVIACRLYCGQNEVLNEVYLMMLVTEGGILEGTRGDMSESMPPFTTQGHIFNRFRALTLLQGLQIGSCKANLVMPWLRWVCTARIPLTIAKGHSGISSYEGKYSPLATVEINGSHVSWVVHRAWVTSSVISSCH
jgi:hypothetical protein